MLKKYESGKNILAPSILSADFANLGKEVLITENAGVSHLHIDVMDGLFVPSISFGFPILESLRKVSHQVFDTHLMIVDPIRYVQRFADAGSDHITVHYEACKEKCQETLEKIRACGCSCGLAVNPDTDIEVVYPYLELVDMVLVMTVEPGFGGQKYIEYTTEKIRQLRQEINRRGLKICIEVDGGIQDGTMQTAMNAGADMFVCGSAVFKNDIAENIKKYTQIMSK